MATPLELYAQAYDADYNRGEWEYARELYTRIIETSPHSDEADYCRVHLERLDKLKSNPDTPALKPRGGGANPLGILSFILIVPVCAAVGFLGWFAWEQHSLNRYLEIVVSAQSDLFASDTAGAELGLKAAQTLLPSSPLAYRLLAQLYLGADNLELAEMQRRRWEVTSPADPALKQFNIRLTSQLEHRVAKQP